MQEWPEAYLCEFEKYEISEWVGVGGGGSRPPDRHLYVKTRMKVILCTDLVSYIIEKLWQVIIIIYIHYIYNLRKHVVQRRVIII